MALDELFRISQLQVEVEVAGDEDSSVLHAPLELYEDRLARQRFQEWSGIDGLLQGVIGKGSNKTVSFIDLEVIRRTKRSSWPQKDEKCERGNAKAL